MTGRFVCVLLLCVAVTMAVSAADHPAAAASGDGRSVASPARPAASLVARSIHAGDSHTCAVSAAGGAACWGANQAAQLGDGTTVDRPVPLYVRGLGGGVGTIAAGFNHTCALTAAGGVRCWGENWFGQLGNNPISDYLPPVNVLGLSGGVNALGSGRSHSCALTAAGGVKCWGDNQAGQLGDGTTVSSVMPRDVVGLTSGVRAIAVGYGHSCALTAAGGVKCWGGNWSGQLGNGAEVDDDSFSPLPVDVVGLSSGVSAVSAGSNHTCALTTTGGVLCWGYNEFGQLGDGTRIDRMTPVAVTGLPGSAAAVSVGGFHTCALTIDGAALCWGENQSGQLGDSTTAERSLPVEVVGLGSGVAAVSAGGFHTCALADGGDILCWGANTYGQLGDAGTEDRPVPAGVFGFGMTPFWQLYLPITPRVGPAGG